jgi:hypothetical protein
LQGSGGDWLDTPWIEVFSVSWILDAMRLAFDAGLTLAEGLFIKDWGHEAKNES